MSDSLTQREAFLKTRYNLLASSDDFVFTSFPTTFFPVPTPDDYAGEFITRYFVQKSNDNPITEIDERQYSQFSSSPFYVVVSLKWQISGPRNNVVDRGQVIREGVENHNMKEIQQAELTMSGIEEKLPNALQFWQGY